MKENNKYNIEEAYEESKLEFVEQLDQDFNSIVEVFDALVNHLHQHLSAFGEGIEEGEEPRLIEYIGQEALITMGLIKYVMKLKKGGN